jgi:hypothetical protein
MPCHVELLACKASGAIQPRKGLEADTMQKRLCLVKFWKMLFSLKLYISFASPLLWGKGAHIGHPFQYKM